jgi:cobalt-zinc-cadmium efflux system outer membrane protein
VPQADLVQAGLLDNPVFDGAVFFPLAGGPVDLELSAVLSFLDVFFLPLHKRVARAQFEAAKLQVTEAVLDFAAGVQRAFYRHQTDEQTLELHRTIVAALSASLEMAQRLHTAGNVPDLNVAQEQAAVEDAKMRLRAAETTASYSPLNISAMA